MSAIAPPPRSSPAPSQQGIRPRRWTREEYYRAAELGLFRPEERLELLDGEILEKMGPHKSPHAAAVAEPARVLPHAFVPGHHVRSQLPLILNDESDSEPDAVVVPGTGFDYQDSHPCAHDALLVVEVSDTTLHFDRGRKRAAYARAGVREYWILNLPERQLQGINPGESWWPRHRKSLGERKQGLRSGSTVSRPRCGTGSEAVTKDYGLT